MIKPDVREFVDNMNNLRMLKKDKKEQLNNLLPEKNLNNYQLEVEKIIVDLVTELFKEKHTEYRIRSGTLFKVIDNILHHREYKKHRFLTIAFFHYNNQMNPDLKSLVEQIEPELLPILEFILEKYNIIKQTINTSEHVVFNQVLNKGIELVSIEYSEIKIFTMRNPSIDIKLTTNANRYYKEIKYLSEVYFGMSSSDLFLLNDKDYYNMFMDLYNKAETHLKQIHDKQNQLKNEINQTLIFSKYAPYIMARRV